MHRLHLKGYVLTSKITTGPDRCFGFVEFPDVNSAQAWMEYNKVELNAVPEAFYCTNYMLLEFFFIHRLPYFENKFRN